MWRGTGCWGEGLSFTLRGYHVNPQAAVPSSPTEAWDGPVSMGRSLSLKNSRGSEDS